MCSHGPTIWSASALACCGLLVPLAAPADVPAVVADFVSLIKAIKLRNSWNEVAYLHVESGHHIHAAAQRQSLRRFRSYMSQTFQVLKYIYIGYQHQWKSITNRMSDHDSRGDEVLAWNVPRQQTYPTVHPTAHSESDANYNKPASSTSTRVISNTKHSSLPSVRWCTVHKQP